MLNIVISLIALLLVFLSASSLALECVGVKIPDDDSIAYRLRGSDTDNNSRCEGFYLSDIGNPSLEVVALLYTPLSYDLSTDKTLSVSAPHVQDQTVQLKVQGIPLKLYYRLDAEIPAGQAFHWSLDILAQEKIQARNLGVLGQLANAVLVPLSLDVAQAAHTALLSLRSSVDVSKVQWRYAEVQEESCNVWSDWADVQPHYGRLFRSGRAIDILLPAAESAQICVEVAAQPRGDGEWLKQLLRIQLH